MNLTLPDIVILIAYLVLIIFAGFWISNRAKKNLDSYFLGGKKIPWYMLGLSNASGQFDIAGTMLMVMLMFVYGLKSVWIPWMWPVWNQIFLMIFLAVWLRKSNVLTGAEWLKTRFGDNRGTRLSHISVVLFALVAVIGFIAYAFEGIGKFAAMFLPWDMGIEFAGVFLDSEKMYALIIMGITTLYVIKGGMYSVVLTEVIQFVVMTVACVIIGIIAINTVSYEQIQAAVPEGWDNMFFGWKMNLDWSNLIPEIQSKIGTDGYELITAFIMMAVFRGVFVSIAGPVPGYDMQRVLATRSPREAALASGIVSLALYFPRYLMISGVAVLGIVYFDRDAIISAQGADFEKILPYVLNNYVGTGVLGIILAGLIAAFMSTYAANVNAGPAYIVNDVYKKFINPHASDRQLVNASYLASFFVVVTGISVGFFINSINDIFLWITGALFAGYAFSNTLKWIWWRFNGYGFFWGMMSGLIAALITSRLLGSEFYEKFGILPTYRLIIEFGIVFIASVIGSMAGTLLTKADEDKVLVEFYKNVKPWGFWKPVYRKALLTDTGLKPNRNFGIDMLNSFVGIIWQMSLTVMPVFLVIRENTMFWTGFGVFALCSVWLKFFWYDKLDVGK
jgi:solute:Na+ symporter, SSS family